MICRLKYGRNSVEHTTYLETTGPKVTLEFKRPKTEMSHPDDVCIGVMTTKKWRSQVSARPFGGLPGRSRHTLWCTCTAVSEAQILIDMCSFIHAHSPVIQISNMTYTTWNLYYVWTDELKVSTLESVYLSGNFMVSQFNFDVIWYWLSNNLMIWTINLSTTLAKWQFSPLRPLDAIWYDIDQKWLSWWLAVWWHQNHYLKQYPLPISEVLWHSQFRSECPDYHFIL